MVLDREAPRTTASRITDRERRPGSAAVGAKRSEVRQGEPEQSIEIGRYAPIDGSRTTTRRGRGTFSVSGEVPEPPRAHRTSP